MDEEEFVIGDWLREELLGKGTFGVVYLWRNLKTNEKLAIKMCKWGECGELTSKHKERWTKEVEMMNQIKHENIIGTKPIPIELREDCISSNISKLPILCMEYCSLGDLRQVLNKPENSYGLPEQQVRSLLKDIKNAIYHLHCLKITHRDIKPENILLYQDDSKPGNIIYKLIDLGYAKEIDSNSVCASFVGTLQYLAPELLYGKSYSNRVDYWSFGLVAFETITGVRPFLPNLPPVQWMQYVKQKTSSHISVFETLKGEVEYSDNIFEENHISDCFKDAISKWLKIALEWDSRKRGHNAEQSVKFLLPSETIDEGMQELTKESSLVVFSLLDEILSKKILIIFSTATYEYLSYEIDDSTLFSTVCNWVERDTKVPQEKHLFISKSDYRIIDPNSFAHCYWNDKNGIMVYFYHLDSIVEENIKLNVPPKLKYCLENPKMHLSYSLLMSVFTSTLYFIDSQKLLSESFIEGYSSRIKQLKNEIPALQSVHNEIDKMFRELLVKCSILTQILNTNGQYVSNNCVIFPDEYKALLKKCEDLRNKAITLSEAWNQLTNRLQSISRRCLDMNEEEIAEKFVINGFTDLNYFAANYITQIRTIPREERTVVRPCLNAVKIVCKCLKLRDNLLQNISKQQIMQKILLINKEIEKMRNTLLNSKENVHELSGSLSYIIEEKEKATLKLLNYLLLSVVDHSALPATLPNNHLERINFKIGEAVRSPQISDIEEIAHRNELDTLLEENKSICLESKSMIDQWWGDYEKMKNDMEWESLL